MIDYQTHCNTLWQTCLFVWFNGLKFCQMTNKLLKNFLKTKQHLPHAISLTFMKHFIAKNVTHLPKILV